MMQILRRYDELKKLFDHIMMRSDCDSRVQPTKRFIKYGVECVDDDIQLDSTRSHPRLWVLSAAYCTSVDWQRHSHLAGTWSGGVLCHRREPTPGLKRSMENRTSGEYKAVSRPSLSDGPVRAASLASSRVRLPYHVPYNGG